MSFDMFVYPSFGKDPVAPAMLPTPAELDAKYDATGTRCPACGRRNPKLLSKCDSYALNCECWWCEKRFGAVVPVRLGPPWASPENRRLPGSDNEWEAPPGWVYDPNERLPQNSVYTGASLTMSYPTPGSLESHLAVRAANTMRRAKYWALAIANAERQRLGLPLLARL